MLPPAESVITLVGNGSRIRAANVPEFVNAICVEGGNLVLQQTTVTGAADRGIFIGNGSQATLTNATISRNAGEGVYNAGSLRVTNSTIADNSGVGLFDTFGNSKVTNSTISGNKDSGVRLLGGDLALTNSTISGNSTDGRGGGIDNYMGDVTLTNSTISGNSASSDGGGVSNYSGNMTVINSTIARNSAARGGGVSTAYTSDLILEKTLISGNRASSGREVLAAPDNRTLRVNNFNVFGFNRNAGISGFKKGATDIVPRVGLAKVLNTTLANNGGRTRTHALPTGSPAIDSVSDGTCPPPPRDQRGTKRPRDGNGDGGAACDTGSFER